MNRNEAAHPARRWRCTRARVGVVASRKRHRGDSSPCGQNGFRVHLQKTAQTQCHWCGPARRAVLSGRASGPGGLRSCGCKGLIRQQVGVVAWHCSHLLGRATALSNHRHFANSARYRRRPRGPMDKGAGDCRFESCRGHLAHRRITARRVALHTCGARGGLAFNAFARASGRTAHR